MSVLHHCSPTPPLFHPKSAGMTRGQEGMSAILGSGHQSLVFVERPERRSSSHLGVLSFTAQCAAPASQTLAETACCGPGRQRRVQESTPPCSTHGVVCTILYLYLPSLLYPVLYLLRYSHVHWTSSQGPVYSTALLNQNLGPATDPKMTSSGALAEQIQRGSHVVVACFGSLLP